MSPLQTRWPTRWMSRRWQAGFTGLSLALTCGACASGPGSALSSRDPLPSAPLAAVAQRPTAPARFDETSGAVRLGQAGSSADFQAMPMASGIQPVSHEAPAVNCPPDAITSCPPEPRLPVYGQNPFGIGMPAYDVMLQPSPHNYPDEYLFDGGDREWPVHYSEDTRLGLDTEDTVAEFTTHHGKQGLTRSNRVAVYAPRFAAVRSVSLPHEEGTFREVAGVQHSGVGTEVRARMAPTLGNKHLAAGGALMRSRASGLESEQLPTDMQQRIRPQLHDKVLNTYEDIAFFNTGIAEQSDVARLNLGIRAALVWSREQSPTIQAKVESATTGLSEIRATALTVIEHNDNPGMLRIVKSADKATAEVGDIVTFAIRYDNLGPNPVGSVRIVDNLTPRMQYVDDSATCDVAGRLVVQDNGEGSLILIWELAEPVPGKTGGVVTFQARVR